MKLLNAKTRKVCNFVENKVPSYAILSHTWDVDEVEFADIQSLLPFYVWKRGWKKIKSCCKQALRQGIEYVWVDTCCIDKSSSAELQEAINSMFRWYEKAAVCYAYLIDVNSDENPEAADSKFRKSRWFSRGWTLQELIAPREVVFFDASWSSIGTRHSLWEPISQITGIERRIIINRTRKTMRDISVAQKMSWAAQRSTTRLEDMAYCLLGIFEVNMPLIYGEGTKAFIRLQEEIMKNSDDQTILAWGFNKPLSTYTDGSSHALATSSNDFSECSHLASLGASEAGDSFSMTQRGLQLYLLVVNLYGNNIILYYI
ncbi:heterokaryon incompatibility protein-domain-containing protein [Annulohypoxylon moriforme]|nr:heterokaryon incompatibility protein-domain-containing protein [Annulohypoxylon moriforme]